MALKKTAKGKKGLKLSATKDANGRVARSSVAVARTNSASKADNAVKSAKIGQKAAQKVAQEVAKRMKFAGTTVAALGKTHKTDTGKNGITPVTTRRTGQGAVPGAVIAQKAGQAGGQRGSQKGVKTLNSRNGLNAGSTHVRSNVTRRVTAAKGYFSSVAGRASLIVPEPTDESVCREVACEGLATTGGYCRLHYIKNWKKIKRKELILREKKLNRYIEELVAKYPDKYIEAIRQDLASDKDFAKVIGDLDLDQSPDDLDSEGEGEEAVLGSIKRDFDDESEGF